jgi:hypothetical protein
MRPALDGTAASDGGVSGTEEWRMKGWFGSGKSIRILHLDPSIWGGEGGFPALFTKCLQQH